MTHYQDCTQPHEHSVCFPCACLRQASANATGTFNKLQAAAAQLDAVAGENATSKSHDVGGLTGLVSVSAKSQICMVEKSAVAGLCGL